MKRISIAAGIVGAACVIASGASAQSAGSFSGNAVDGSHISLTVEQSGSTFTVTNMNVEILGDCKKTGLTVDEGWGFTINQDISSGSANFNSHNDYYYTTGSMHFSGHTTIKGTITSYTATFVPGATPPKQAQFCLAAQQAFTLTKEAPGRVPPLQANVDTGRLKPGR
jgi:hypothetical protein